MERRVLIAVLLSFLVLFGYQLLFPPPPEPPRAKAGAAAQQPAASGQAAVTPSAAPQAEAVAGTVEVGGPARDVTVEASDVRAIFTTRGGVLKSWRLKRYQDAAGQPLEWCRRTCRRTRQSPSRWRPTIRRSPLALRQRIHEQRHQRERPGRPADADVRLHRSLGSGREEDIHLYAGQAL